MRLKIAPQQRHQKMKCSGGRPCMRCQRNGVDCVYEPAAKRLPPAERKVSQPTAPSNMDFQLGSGQSAHSLITDYSQLPTDYGMDPRMRQPTYQPPMSAAVPPRAPYLQGFTDASSYALPTYTGQPMAASFMYGNGVQPHPQPQQSFNNPMFLPSVPQQNMALPASSALPMQISHHVPASQPFSPHASNLQQQQSGDRPHKRKRAFMDTPGEQSRSSNRMSIRTFLLNPADERVRALSPPLPSFPNGPDELGHLSVETENLGPLESVVSKGIVPESLAAQFYSRFNEVYANRLGWQNNPSFQTSLSRSPLMLAAVCAVVSRGYRQSPQWQQCAAEAEALGRALLFVGDVNSEGASFSDFKGLAIMCIYQCKPQLAAHVVSIAHELGLHSVFAKLTDPVLRGQADEAILIEKGRAWLTIYIYSHMFSLCSQEPVLVHTSRELVTRQCAVLRSSQKADRETDLLLSAHAELVAMLAQMKHDVGELSDNSASQNVSLFASVAHYVTQLKSWEQRWSETWLWQEEGRMPLPNESGCIHLELGYNYARLFIHAYAVWPISDGTAIINDPQQLTAAMVVLETSLKTVEYSKSMRKSTDAPLAFDYDYCSLGFALSCMFRLAMVLPGHPEVQKTRASFRSLFGHTTAQASSWTHGLAIHKFLATVDSLGLAVRHLHQQAANGSPNGKQSTVAQILPQSLSAEDVRMLDLLARDPQVFLQICGLNNPQIAYGPQV